MSQAETYNILMYSHDTYGLGHIRRTMAIANHLRDSGTNVLILTGSPIAGRFSFSEQVDFVRIPGMIKKTNDEYQSLSIRIDQAKALAIRTSIIMATAQTFQPDLFIVDKEPLGLKGEVLPTLQWFKEHSPNTNVVLGLRDILDESEVVCRDWTKKGIYQHIDKLYDEIWVYGDKDIYNPITEYNIPKALDARTLFTGYIPRRIEKGSTRSEIRKKYRILDCDKLILVTAGGGGDGSEIFEHCIEMHEYFPTSLPFKTIMITGPFMPRAKLTELRVKAREYGIKLIPFHSQVEDMVKAADLVISMGGYNTICEILTQNTPALIIPRETPRKEQLIRAQHLKKRGLLDYIEWTKVNPRVLREKVSYLLAESEYYQKTISEFALSGLDRMRSRLHELKEIRENNEPK
ncbi:MAG: glycosyltransferase [Desulfotalea sp.]